MGDKTVCFKKLTRNLLSAYLSVILNILFVYLRGFICLHLHTQQNNLMLETVIYFVHIDMKSSKARKSFEKNNLCNLFCSCTSGLFVKILKKICIYNHRFYEPKHHNKLLIKLLKYQELQGFDSLLLSHHHNLHVFIMLFYLLLYFGIGVAISNPLEFQNVSSIKIESVTDTAFWVLGSGVQASQVPQAGQEPSYALYVGRGQVNGQWIPGKGYFRGNVFYVKVGWDGREVDITDSQVRKCFIFT